MHATKEKEVKKYRGNLDVLYVATTSHNFSTAR